MKLLKSLFLMLIAMVVVVGCSTEKEDKQAESKQTTETNTKKEDKKESK